MVLFFQKGRGKSVFFETCKLFGLYSENFFDFFGLYTEILFENSD